MVQYEFDHGLGDTILKHRKDLTQVVGKFDKSEQDYFNHVTLKLKELEAPSENSILCSVIPLASDKLNGYNILVHGSIHLCGVDSYDDHRVTQHVDNLRLPS
jgi:hypothetical protein